MKSLHKPLAGLVLLVNTLSPSISAEEINPDGWPVPDIKSAKFYYEKEKDALREIPGDESLLGVYKATDGTYFNTVTYRDIIFSYFIDTNGRPPMEYIISDMDKDGIYETKFNLDPNIDNESFPSPHWIVQESRGYKNNNK